MPATVASPVDAFLDRLFADLAPPTRLTVADFADQELFVTSGPLAGTRWRTDFAPYQRGIMNAHHEPGVEIVVVMGSSQWGKALALDTPIPTPGGWTTMGAVQPGDRIFDESGSPCEVTFATEVMEDRPCYRVAFSDGSELVADSEHQWFVESDTHLQKGPWRKPWIHSGVLTTREIAKSYRWLKNRNRYAVPIAKPITCRRRSLPVHPYVLGAWLGDGSADCARFFTNDREVLQRLEECGQRCVKNTSPYTYGLPGLAAKLRPLGVLSNKHIPARYLRASTDQRLELLAGLMDTDGSIEANTSRCEFSTTSRALADGMVDLLCGLGLKPIVKIVKPTTKYKGNLVAGAQAWRIRFVAYSNVAVFSLPRKQERLKARTGRRTTETERRRIIGVEPVPSVPVRCIQVDSPSHLYLAGRTMIPTHNTAIAVNKVAYAIAHNPCSVLVVEPTDKPMAQDFSRNRLRPTIKASPILNERVSRARAKDGSNSALLITYRGGSVALAGANSASSLAARPVKLLILDEMDRYPAELPGEGSTVSIAMKRTTTFGAQREILLLSSPTLAGAPIHSWFLRGDQRRYYVPCPACRHMHPYEWCNVQWTDHDPATARLICPRCDYRINDAERVGQLAYGEWRGEQIERADPTIVSFHLWEAYSPLSKLSDIVAGFLRAREKQKAGDRAEMHTWQNTTLGEPVDPDEGTGADQNALIMRREQDREWPLDVDLPAGGCCLTMGVDVQDDRLEALIVGWAPREESWLVDRQTIPGDTSQADPWAELDRLLEVTYRHASGQRLPVHATCIDSGGHRTTLVYDYAEKKAARRVYATIGRDGQRPITSSPSPRRWGRSERQVPLYTIGVDAAKALIVSRLMLTEKGPGFVHLPHRDWCDDELAAQLTSERLVVKWDKGLPVQIWKKTRPRNEALDCFVMALAALRLMNPKLEFMASILNAPVPSPEPPNRKPPVSSTPPTGTAPAPRHTSQQPIRRVARSRYLGG